MTIELIPNENMYVSIKNPVDLIYADMIYENLDFSWVDHFWSFLKPNGIFIIQTDWHSVAEVKVYTQTMPDAFFVNWLIFKCEFGNFPKNKFRQCHDDILIFSKGKDYKFYSDRVQVPKATAGSKGLNPSGRETKLATSVITDICLTTISNERIKDEDGKCIRWQKPLALLNRLFLPFTDEGDLIVDPFAGTGSSGVWAIQNKRDWIGIENDIDVFWIAKDRLDREMNESIS
jgi:site-specific DNA-methyltransferase (adenine-specific)